MFGLDERRPAAAVPPARGLFSYTAVVLADSEQMARTCGLAGLARMCGRVSESAERGRGKGQCGGVYKKEEE